MGRATSETDWIHRPGRGLLLGAALLVLGSGWPGRASAQPPDARAIRPLVMLLVDTSGSMELLPNCVCRTPSCQECYPVCRNAPGDDRNRWATVLEALTGEWSDFRCRKENRATYPKTEYDYLYPVPHFRIVSVGGQVANGVLDAYIDRARFGLMTFDGQPTFFDSSELVTERIYRLRLRDARRGLGMFSYGEPKPFTFPGCGQPFMIDNGARNEDAPVGALISVGRERDDFVAINQNIQTELVRVRPYGGTPIAGMLDDVRYYFQNHPDVRPASPDGSSGDPFYACRPRYVVMLTDGTPSGEMREYGCGAAGYSCPYDRSWDIAAQLCDFRPGSGCRGDVDGVFVVGFDIRDPAARRLLDEIANSGGTGSALFAEDRATLVAQLGRVIDRAAPQASTRTRPAFVNAALESDTPRQMQFNTGFRVPLARGESWRGVLERRRFECNAALEPEPKPIDPARDRFHEVLDRQSRSPLASSLPACPPGKPRCLLTVLPSRAGDVDEHLGGKNCFPGEGGSLACYAPVTLAGGSALPGPGPGGAEPGCGVRGSTGAPAPAMPRETGLDLLPLDESVAAAYFGPSTDAALRDRVVAWLHGLPGSGRESGRLGDIYHSSPIVVGPPQRDLPDESFNLFRRRPDVENRPHVLYVGTNDGILHAFVADDVEITDGPHRGTRLTAGTELWGFVPPFLLPKVPSALDSHQIMVDGTPVVRDVFLRRLPGQVPDGDLYRTVLVVGLRRGGAAYVAMDVTDPLRPQFLWQFTDPQMGETLGKPALAQVLLETADGLEERAVAILPGGEGEDVAGRGCGAGRDGERGCRPMGFGLVPPPEGYSDQRDRFGCWSNRGRRLFVVDVATGQRIAVFDDRTFNSPLTGGVTVFPGEPGTVATRAFVTDRDGVLWKLDLSSPRVSDWQVVPFHDLFYDGRDARASQPALELPLVSVDKEGRLVVIQGSSDVDRLDEVDDHRIASLMEVLDFDAAGRVRRSQTRLNWEIRLENEQLTGPIELFDGVAYFATFRAVADPSNACELGSSRIWGVEYIRSEDGSSLPRAALPVSGSPDRKQHWLGPYDNEIVMGVSVTQRPQCVSLSEVSVTDPYVGSRTYQRIGAKGGGRFQLVALAGGSGPRAAGSAIREVSVPDIQQPVAYTQVEAYAGTVE